MQQILGIALSQIGSPLHTLLTILGIGLFCGIIELGRRLHR
jgi:hypothetical protein